MSKYNNLIVRYLLGARGFQTRGSKKYLKKHALFMAYPYLFWCLYIGSESIQA